MAAMPRPEVLVVTRAVGLTRGATRAKSWRLTSRSSTTASKTQSASLSCAQSSSKLPARMRAACSARCSGVGLSFLRTSSARRAEGAAIRPARGTVEERDVEPLRDRVGRHLGAHGPRPQHHDLRMSVFIWSWPPQAAFVERSMTSLYFCSTTRRFTLSVGVSSPASSVNSRASRAIFLIFSNWARSGQDVAIELARSAPSPRAGSTSSSRLPAARPFSLRPLLQGLEVRDHEGGREVPLVADHHDLGDERVRLQAVLDGLGGDVLAARGHDDVLLAVGDDEEAVGVEDRRCRRCGTSRPRRSPPRWPRAC